MLTCRVCGSDDVLPCFTQCTVKLRDGSTVIVDVCRQPCHAKIKAECLSKADLDSKYPPQTDAK